MSFDMKKLMSVTNRSGGIVIYKIPEHNIRREFSERETKQIPYEELVWLSYQPGGRTLMQNMLLIQNPQAVESLNITAEQEYFMTEKDVIDMLVNGSLDQLLDALDFAPQGVIQIIKDQAVALPIYDMRKREAIFNATGFDVNAAVENAKPDEGEVQVKAPAATRRVQKTSETPSAPARRTEAPAPKQYVVVDSSSNTEE